MIAPLPDPCWTVTAGDGEWHCPAREDALRAACDELAGADFDALCEGTLQVPVTSPRPAWCWTLTCDEPGCGAYYGDPEEEFAFHAPTGAVLKDWARPDGWTFTIDGLARCPAHRRTEIPGQLAIPGQEGHEPSLTPP